MPSECESVKLKGLSKEQLLQIKENEPLRYKELDWRGVDVELIDYFFPISDGFGRIPPPWPYLVSTTRLDEWRKLSESDQKVQLEQEAVQSAASLLLSKRLEETSINESQQQNNSKERQKQDVSSLDSTSSNVGEDRAVPVSTKDKGKSVKKKEGSVVKPAKSRRLPKWQLRALQAIQGESVKEKGLTKKQLKRIQKEQPNRFETFDWRGADLELIDFFFPTIARWGKLPPPPSHFASTTKLKKWRRFTKGMQQYHIDKEPLEVLEESVTLCAASTSPLTKDCAKEGLTPLAASTSSSTKDCAGEGVLLPKDDFVLSLFV